MSLDRCLPKYLLLLVAILATDSTVAADKNVLVLLSKEQQEYQEVATSLRQILERPDGQPIRLHVVALPEGARRLTDDSKTAPDMIVTVGAQAARLTALQRTTVPVLYTLLPRQSYLELTRNRSHERIRRHSAIYLDQPLRRQLNLIGFALPEHSRIVAVLGPSTAALEDELAVAARDRDIDLRVQRLTVSEELIPLLRETIEEGDVLLSLPDPAVFNSNTIHHLLIASYHRKVPVVGFSRGFIEAGALLAVYSTPTQAGHQAAEVVRQALRTPGRSLPSPQYPKYFTVAVNRRVAASLGIEVPDEKVLLDRLQDHPE